MLPKPEEGRSFLRVILTTRIGSSAGRVGGVALTRILAAEFLPGRYREFTVWRASDRRRIRPEKFLGGKCKVLRIRSGQILVSQRDGQIFGCKGLQNQIPADVRYMSDWP